MKRFEMEDTPGKFKSVKDFMKCFDQATIDVAHHEKNLSEADFRALVYDSELLDNALVLELFDRVSTEINKHLESGENEE